MTATKTITINPLGARVLLRHLEAEERSAGGIVIPDTAKKKPKEAEVLAVGPGRRTEDGMTIPIPLQKGDRVLVSSYGGTELKRDAEKLLIMNESDVLAVLS